MSAPITTQIPSSPAPKFFIITRHQKTAQLLQKLGGKVVATINEVPANSLVVGVLPLDLVAMLTKNGSRFISVTIDTKKFEDRFNTPYNPKTAETYINSLSDEEFISLLSFILYEKVNVEPIDTNKVIEECKGADTIYYSGSKPFADGLTKLCGKQVVADINKIPKTARVIAFTPIDGQGYYLKVMSRDLVVNNADEFLHAINNGQIRVYKATSVMKRLSWQEVQQLIRSRDEDNIQETIQMKTVTKDL